jgi:enamine deaminase RidA (YjgF/YER057c/UK114 family)
VQRGKRRGGEQDGGAGLTVPGSADAKLAADLVVAGGLAFVSGVGPVDLANGRVPVPERVEAQVRKIFANLDAILEPAGLARRNLAFVRIHLVDFERLIERMNTAYLSCVGEGPLPARTVVGVTGLTRGALVEMDFIVRAS